jgi:hypothetical protein
MLPRDISSRFPRLVMGEMKNVLQIQIFFTSQLCQFVTDAYRQIYRLIMLIITQNDGVGICQTGDKIQHLSVFVCLFYAFCSDLSSSLSKMYKKERKQKLFFCFEKWVKGIRISWL